MTLADVNIYTFSAMLMGLVELIKIYLPDNIKGKIIPLMSLVLGGVMGYFLPTIGLFTGLITAGTLSGLYKVGTDQIKNLSIGKTNDVKPQ